MSLLLPVGWADVATRHDLEALGHMLDGRVDRVRVEMAELRTELKTEMADIRTEMAGLRADLKSDMAANQRQLLFAVLGAMLTMIGLTTATFALT